MSSYNNKNYLNIFIFILYDKEILFLIKNIFKEEYSLSFFFHALVETRSEAAKYNNFNNIRTMYSDVFL